MGGEERKGFMADEDGLGGTFGRGMPILCRINSIGL